MKKPLSEISRRAVIGSLIAAPFVVRPAEAKAKVRALSMLNLHTNEAIKATYWRNGRYDPAAWVDINEFLRDWRTDAVHPIDPKVLDIIHRVSSVLRHRGPVEILSGYRSPQTNAMLRRASSGVAKNSYHVQGMAIDFTLPDQSLTRTFRAAVALEAGGVGLYRRSNFVHVDSGPPRSWGT